MPADRLVVLVNGVPAAGKSTLAGPLSAALGLPLIGKDLIKETHADLLGSEPPDGRSQRDWNNALGRAASETMWTLLAVAPRGAVLESSWRADVRHLVAGGLERAGVTRTDVVEVWCDVPPELAQQRDAARWSARHPIHGARLTDAESARIQAHAEPLAFGPVLRVDTTRPLTSSDIAALVTRCRTAVPPS